MGFHPRKKPKSLAPKSQGGEMPGHGPHAGIRSGGGKTISGRVSGKVGRRTAKKKNHRATRQWGRRTRKKIPEEKKKKRQTLAKRKVGCNELENRTKKKTHGERGEAKSRRWEKTREHQKKRVPTHVPKSQKLKKSHLHTDRRGPTDNLPKR